MDYTDKNRLRDIAEETKKNAYEKYLPQYQNFYEHFLYPAMIKEAEKGRFCIGLEMTDETVWYQFAYEWTRGNIPKNDFSKDHLKKFLNDKGYSLEVVSVDHKTAYINISW